MNRSNWSQRGPSDANRTRGRKWMAIRKRIMARDNWQCIRCTTNERPTPCSIVDHIIPIAKGGTDADTNLRSLCHPCHQDVTAEQFGSRPRTSTGLDGWPTDTTP